jgi:hypothetical protein
MAVMSESDGCDILRVVSHLFHNPLDMLVFLVFRPETARELRRHRGVTGVLQRCYRGVTEVLQRCYRGVTEMLQGCYRGVTVTGVSQKCYRGVAGVSQKCYLAWRVTRHHLTTVCKH